MVALTAYLSRLYGPLTALSNVQVDVMTALVSFDRVFEVLDLAPMIADKPDAAICRSPPARPASIEFDHVDFRYPTADEVSLASLESVAVLDNAPERQVLHDVSFRAEPGQLVALVGPSGAGKTTITQLVTRMYDVQAGAVRIGGQRRARRHADVAARRRRRRHPGRAHVPRHDPRQPALRPARTPPTTSCGRRSTAAQIGDLVASLPDGLDTVVGDRGYRLSGGEKQRLAIARLLLKAPAVVVLDEATAHLDSESEVAVQRALGDGARRPHVARHRAPAVDGPRGRPDPGGRRRPDRRARHATTSCSRPAASTPSSTAPSSSGRPTALSSQWRLPLPA